MPNHHFGHVTEYFFALSRHSMSAHPDKITGKDHRLLSEWPIFVKY